MSEIAELSYCSLPILSNEELLVLQADEAISYGIVGYHVMQRNPYFYDIIQHDIEQWYEHEAPKIGDDELFEFIEGIEAGYKFFIGVVTTIKLMRRQHIETESFMEGALIVGTVPQIGPREVERIQLVRSGEAEIDHCIYGLDAKSNELADRDASQYLYYQAFRLQILFNNELEDIEQTMGDAYGSADDERVIAHINGFEHGVANAIEMYLQAAEEAVIVSYEQQM